MRDSRRWIGPRRSTLEAAEEEEFVPDNPPAQGSAVLIALQRVTSSCEVPASVEVAVPQVIKQIPMELIRSGYGDRVHYAARMFAILRRQGARFNAEFLQGIGKRKGHIHVGKCVYVITAIQQVIGPVRLAAGNRNSRRTVKIFAAREVATGWAYRHRRT